MVQITDERFPIWMNNFLECNRDDIVSRIEAHVDDLVGEIRANPGTRSFQAEGYLEDLCDEYLWERLETSNFHGSEDKEVAHWFAMNVLAGDCEKWVYWLEGVVDDQEH